ncbi:unnamed protein product [Paramecium pentaurelia]|uniref:Transmembrane protein n=1 Tax=Paramecium pentaurelia TaxID=43138 RepID=A0A8S1U8C1_9CILI|nr:unnamed protein product [Paramecium pentaurelia]
MNKKQESFTRVLKEKIKLMDIFGQSIQLSFRQEEQHTTFVGGVASIFVLATIISFFYSNIIGFFTMNQVKSSTEMIFEDDPGIIQLNSNSFMFAIQIEHDNFVDTPYFNITVEQRHYKNQNGTLTKLPNEYIDLVICTQDHFQQIFQSSNIDYAEQFKDLNMTNFLCPNIQKNNVWTVGGAYTSSDYYFLKFSVTTCVNDSYSNFSWKPKCKTQDEMFTQLKAQGSFRFQLFTTNFIVNPDSPQEYITPYLAIEQFYTFVPNQMFVQSDIFVREKRINTDKGILMYPMNVEETIAYREHMDSRQQFEIGGLNSNYFAAFYLQRSPFSYNISRSFVTLDELLSYLGGFSQFMTVILGMIINVYNKQSLLLQLANDLYEFNFQEQQENTRAFISNLLQQSRHGREMIKQKGHIKELKIHSINPFTSKPPMDQKVSQIISPQRTQNQFIQISSTRQLQSIKEKTYDQYEKFKQLMINQKKLTLGFRILLGDLLPFECFQDPESVLFKKAMSQVSKELDIRFIMNQLHEITKLKKVIFNREQFQLFNFSHKPTISLIKEKKNRLSSKFFYLGEEEAINNELQNQYNTLVQAYSKLTSCDTQFSDEQTQLNQRIIGLLGRDLPLWIEMELQQENSESIKEPEPDDLDEISKT